MFVHSINPVLLEIFGLRIHYYGLMYAILFLSSFFVARWYLKRFKYDPDHADTMLIIAVVSVIVGARLGHVFFYSWDYYSENLMEIFYVWQGGLASHGAAIALIFGAWLMMKITKIRFWVLADLVVLGASIGVILVRIGNFINGEIVGRVTDVAWGVVFPCNGLVRGICGGQVRHPVQLYESLLGIVMFVAMMLILTKWKKYKHGALSAFFLIGYFGGRFFLEYFKEYDGTLIWPPLTNGQILSIPMVILGLVIGWIAYSKNNA